MPARIVIDINHLGRDWVVGDIHGCFATLDRALEEIGFDPGADRLFSVGDLVDRGPESRRALDYLKQPWFYAVRGNHEQMLLDAADNDPKILYLWWANGGTWFVDEPEQTQAALRTAIAALPLIIEVATSVGVVGIVHADVPRKLSWQDFVGRVESGDAKAVETALWGRNRALGRVRKGVNGVARVFCGHTPVTGGVRSVGNVYCMDTGAVYGLTQGFSGASLAIMQLTSDEAHLRAVIDRPSALSDSL